MRHQTKKDIRLKNGDILPKGTDVHVGFLGPRHTQGATLCLLYLSWVGKSGKDYGQTPLRFSLARLPEFLTGYQQPTIASLEKWKTQGYGLSVSSRQVPAAGYGSDGAPSWLLVLNYL